MNYGNILKDNLLKFSWLYLISRPYLPFDIFIYKIKCLIGISLNKINICTSKNAHIISFVINMKVISFHFLWHIADSMTDITPHLSIIVSCSFFILDNEFMIP